MPKGQPFSWASNMAGGSEPQERGPQHSRPSSFSHVWVSSRPQPPPATPKNAIFGHTHRPPSQSTSQRQPPPCLLLGTYKRRGPCSWPTVRRALRPPDAKHAWWEEEPEQRGERLPTFGWDTTEAVPASAGDEGASQEEDAQSAEAAAEEEHQPSWHERDRPSFWDQRHAARGCRPSTERRGAQACLPAGG